MIKNKVVLSGLIATLVLTSNISTIQSFAESNNINKTQISSEISFNEKFKVFMMTQESLPENVSVQTKVISKDHVIQYFEDYKTSTKDITEIKMQNGEIILDFYNESHEQSSKVHSIVIPSTNVAKIEVTGYGEISPLADLGDYSWHKYGTQYQETDLSNKSISLMKSIMIGVLTKDMKIPVSSAISVAADTIASKAYGASKVTVRTQRIMYWRNSRPTEPRNYVHSWDYEVRMWKNFDPVKVVSKFTETFYHDYKW